MFGLFSSSGQQCNALYYQLEKLRMHHVIFQVCACVLRRDCFAPTSAGGSKYERAKCMNTCVFFVFYVRGHYGQLFLIVFYYKTTSYLGNFEIHQYVCP